jgi:hypothetical protein
MELEMKTNSMKSLVWAGAIPAAIFPACNYTVGECYPREQGDGSGDTGVVIVSSGAGGFGDAPPKQPQDVTNPPPDCNIVPGSPCEEKCQSDYEAEAAKCGQVEASSARQACQGTAYDNYKNCRTACNNDPREPCKQLCDKNYEDCVKSCNTLKCYAACMVIYKNCLRGC